MLGVGQGQGGHVGGLRAPHRAGQSSEQDAEREDQRTLWVEGRGEIAGEGGERDDHCPLGGQSVDEPGGGQARDDSRPVHHGQGGDAQSTSRVEGALKALGEMEKRGER